MKKIFYFISNFLKKILYINYKIIFGIIFFNFIMLYITYNIFYGDRGFISSQIILNDIKNKEIELQFLYMKKKQMERNIKILRNSDFENDYIDELSRKYFMVGEDGENMIIFLD